LSISGIADAVACYDNYYAQFESDGYYPEASWIPPENTVTVDNIKLFFFNAGGIVFYTDLTENTDDLLELSSAVAVRQYIRSAAGKVFTHSIVNTSSQIQKLVKVRTVADRERLKTHLKIAAMISLVGFVI